MSTFVVAVGERVLFGIHPFHDGRGSREQTRGIVRAWERARDVDGDARG